MTRDNCSSEQFRRNRQLVRILRVGSYIASATEFVASMYGHEALALCAKTCALICRGLAECLRKRA
jgi:hypothetical protein